MLLLMLWAKRLLPLHGLALEPVNTYFTCPRSTSPRMSLPLVCLSTTSMWRPVTNARPPLTGTPAWSCEYT